MSIGKLQLHGRDASPSCDRRSAPRRDSQPTRESSSAFRGSSQSDLTVFTAEGDRITISQAAQVQSASTAQSTGFQSSSQLRVAVQGNLSEAELKDLGTLLTNLAQGTTGQTQSSDAGFADLTSLSAFSYRYRQTVEAGSLVRASG